MSFEYTCPRAELVDDYEAPLFEETSAIRWAHNIPRFGHTSNLTALIEGSEEDGLDYVRGMIASSIAIFATFTVWLLIILILRCLGPQRVGMWSGMIQPLPPEPIRPSDEEQIIVDSKETEGQVPSESNRAGDQQNILTEESSADRGDADDGSSGDVMKGDDEFEQRHAEWIQLERRHNTYLTAARGMAVFSCLAIIINAILLGVKGVGSLTESLGSGQDTLDLINSLIEGTVNLIDDVLAAGNAAKEDTTELMRATNTFCPRVASRICEDVLSARACSYDGLPFREEVKKVIEFYQGVKDVAFDDLQSMRGDLVASQEFVSKMREATEDFNWAFYCCLAFAVALALLCFYLMVAIIQSWKGQETKAFRCFRKYLVLPLFSLLVALSFVFSVVFIIGSIGSADVCYDSPDGKILSILTKEQENNSSIVLEFLIYYISGCPSDFQPSELLEKAILFTALVPSLGALSGAFIAARDQIQETCGTDVTPLTTASKVAAEGLCRFSSTIQGIRELMKCSNWNPLYTTSTYETICYNGVDGFSWIATTQFLIVFFAMVILTLRVSFSKVIEEEDEDEAVAVVAGSSTGAEEDEEEVIVEGQQTDQ